VPNSGYDNLNLLSANDKVIKLWRLHDKPDRKTTYASLENGKLIMPKSKITNTGFKSQNRRQYKNCHTYPINSLTVSSDGENFISADEHNINLWNYENSAVSYNLVNLPHSQGEEFQEIITSV